MIEILDLRHLDVPVGGARRFDDRVPVAPLVLGGQEYHCEPPAPEMRLDAVRSLGAAWHFRLRGGCTVTGPCWRCLNAAHVPIRLDATEVSDPSAGDPEMESLYVEEDRLDVAGWARDAVAEALPPTILCREDCAGLCPTCGTDLNTGSCDCTPPVGDSRWGALADLAERLRAEED